MHKASSWLGSKFEELLEATARIFPGGVIARCGWDTRKPLVIMRLGGIVKLADGDMMGYG